MPKGGWVGNAKGGHARVRGALTLGRVNARHEILKTAINRVFRGVSTARLPKLSHASQALAEPGARSDGSATGGDLGTNHNASKYTASANTFGTLTAADIAGLIGTLPEYALPGAAFYASNIGAANSL
jgi:hypothetical protein